MVILTLIDFAVVTAMIEGGFGESLSLEQDAIRAGEKQRAIRGKN